MNEPSNQDLLEELDITVEKEHKPALDPSQVRVIAGFEEIQEFVERQGRPPESGRGQELFERLYRIRLDRIVSRPEYRALVADRDHQGLLRDSGAVSHPEREYNSDAEMLEALGVDLSQEDDITSLQHVKPRAVVRAAADEIASRHVCKDFHTFEPLFARVNSELKRGDCKTARFEKNTDIRESSFFILNGLMVYVAEVGQPIKAPNGANDARMRVIFSNGTESNLLKRSLQRALYKDEAGRRISGLDCGPMFDSELEDELASGTIYVLRSLSDNPAIAASRKVIHKIGVTGGEVEKRIANASQEPTFLMAEVEVVATYTLYNINRTKLENLLHRFFASARLDIEIMDRFGKPFVPREWFLVPLPAIDKAVEKIRDETLTQFEYDTDSASLTAKQSR